MLSQITGQGLSCSIRNRNQIFNANSFIDLSADSSCHYRHLQSFTGRIDSCSSSGRSASGNQNIKMMFTRSYFLGTRSSLGFQFVQQFSQRTASDVQQFSTNKDCRNRLNLEALSLFLKQSSVYSHMGDLRIEQCHDIQSLHNIRTIGTRQ